MSEAGGNTNHAPEQSGRGLSLEWRALLDTGCPRCREELSYFDNVGLYKCPCGFKISREKFQEIKDKMISGDIGRGYCFGNYDDEPPF